MLHIKIMEKKTKLFTDELNPAAAKKAKGFSINGIKLTRHQEKFPI